MFVKATTPDPDMWVKCIECGWLGTIRETRCPPDDIATCPTCGCPVEKESERMSVSNYAAVGAFHIKFGVPNAHTAGTHPRHISVDLQQFRLKFLREEMAELERAYDNHDLPGIADALIDLVYVALGTAQVHGLPWQELFDEVQRANMTKERCGIDHAFMPGTLVPERCCFLEKDDICGKPRSAHSLRGSAHDVIKPEDWTAPNIEGVLRRFGWEG